MKVFLVVFLMSGLCLSQGLNAGPFFVRTLEGRTLTFEVGDISPGSAGSFERLKDLVAEAIGRRPEDITLYLAGQKIQNDDFVNKNLRRETTLSIVTRLVPGVG